MTTTATLHIRDSRDEWILVAAYPTIEAAVEDSWVFISLGFATQVGTE